MSLKLSSALRNFINEGGSLKQALSNCGLKLYTGAQPATAETAPPGTLGCLLTNNAGAWTREVLSVGSVALTGGASGSLNTLTVNSLEIMGSATNFNTSLTQTATDIVTKINNNPKNILFLASNVGGTSQTITLTAKPGLGSLPNAWVVASTATTITKTDTNMAGGVTALNGLTWGDSAAGTLVKDPTQTWSGTALQSVTVGWFRFEAAVLDGLATDATESVIRLDGSIGISGGEMNTGSPAIVAGIVQRLDSFSLTLPTD